MCSLCLETVPSRAIRGRQGSSPGISGKGRLLAEGQGLLPCLPLDLSTGERLGLGWRCNGLGEGDNETAATAQKCAGDQSFSVINS